MNIRCYFTVMCDFILQAWGLGSDWWVGRRLGFSMFVFTDGFEHRLCVLPMSNLFLPVWRGAVKIYYVSLPPAFVISTDAKKLLNVVLTRMTVPLEWLCRHLRLLWLYINTDSARTCIKVGTHFQGDAKVAKRFFADGTWQQVGMFALKG